MNIYTLVAVTLKIQNTMFIVFVPLGDIKIWSALHGMWRR
jgi:hypothetical protein